MFSPPFNLPDDYKLRQAKRKVQNLLKFSAFFIEK